MASLRELLNDILVEGWAGARGVPDGSGPGPGMTAKGRQQGMANGINKDAVHSAAARAAKTIFGKVNEKELKKTVAAAIKKAKDTKQAIQIATDMMRG